VLIGDHQRLRGLFTRFKATHESENLPECERLAGIIARELGIHMEIEEQTFYSGIRELNPELGETIDEGLEEHHEVKILLGEIAVLDPSDSAWLAKMTVVIEDNDHHFEEEETEMFPSVRSAADAQWLIAMGERLEENKRALGAPTVADKVDLSNVELHERATAQEIPGRSTMNHEQLAASVGDE
jgi:hypothetical protein